MYSKDDIKTMAMKELGREDVPDFLDTDESDIKNINLQYDLIYSYALSRYNWSFAKEWADLSSYTEMTGKYKYKLALPDDFVYLRAVFEDEKYQKATNDYEFHKGAILSNKLPLYIEYTVRLDENDLPAYFVEWFKFRLALALAINATGDANLIQYLSGKEAFEYQNAVNADSRQKGVKVLDSSYFLCRG